MNDKRLHALLEMAVQAARYAGDHAMTHRQRRTEADTRSAHDVKLALDRECQIKAAEIIHAAYPDHEILGEEASHGRDGAEFRWIVDPIDGTVNFSHGWTIWCTSVAVEQAGKTLAGAIYAPALGELYTASAGSTAELNGSPIRVSAIDRLQESLILTDTNKEPMDFDSGAELYRKFLYGAQKARITGSAALDICRVAQGHAEAYTALGIYPWDTAAAALILERAGGQSEVIEQLEGHRFRAIYTNGAVHHEVRKVFTSVLFDV